MTDSTSTAPLSAEIIWGGEFDYEEIPKNMFGMEINNRGLQAVGFISIKWEKEAPTHAEVDGIEGWKVKFHTIDYSNDENRFYIETDTGAVIYLMARLKRVNFSIATENQATVDYEVEKIKKLFPVEPIKLDPSSMNLGVWYASPHGAMSQDNKITPLMWRDIERNYPKETRESLENLMGLTPPLDSGRLILWHGPPGTGKSSAIRSLMYSWLPWCNSAYVADPDEFFSSANYMMSVLMSNKSAQPEWDFYYEEDDEEDNEDEKYYTLKGTDRWNLLIIEDADEFLVADAKDRTGQAMSRLLNLADGLLGQGRKFMMLITTNEKMSNINKAVAREGRCMANVAFRDFDRDEAIRWLGPEADLITAKSTNSPYTGQVFSLAQLYDLRRHTQQIHVPEEQVSIGQYL